jgi:hypothetical protein
MYQEISGNPGPFCARQNNPSAFFDGRLTPAAGQGSHCFILKPSPSIRFRETARHQSQVSNRAGFFPTKKLLTGIICSDKFLKRTAHSFPC